MLGSRSIEKWNYIYGIYNLRTWVFEHRSNTGGGKAMILPVHLFDLVQAFLVVTILDRLSFVVKLFTFGEGNF